MAGMASSFHSLRTEKSDLIHDEPMLKRIFDIIFSLLGLFVLSPILLGLTFLIKKEDGGPVFYRGVRVGKDSKLFKIFKFRTMVVNAEKIGGSSTADDDPRITKIGKIFRKYKLDEIPQLINVLKGEMSFVGPRPEVPMEVETYNKDVKRILLVSPGITDWASLKFHNEGEILKGSQDPHKTYQEEIRPEKLRLALKYANEGTFMTDIKIILQTLLTLVKTRK
jgi:lipopolysaccharide/colanic/teichoic acid biosynthesis glycosyltransferase